MSKVQANQYHAKITINFYKNIFSYSSVNTISTTIRPYEEAATATDENRRKAALLLPGSFSSA